MFRNLHEGRTDGGVLRRALATSLAVTAAAALVHPAAAAEPAPATVSDKIVISDLDLSREVDAKALLRRIHTTAAQLCAHGAEQWRVYLNANPRFQRCVARATQTTVEKANSPILTAMYNGLPMVVAKR
jgi:UrcA family protein